MAGERDEPGARERGAREPGAARRTRRRRAHASGIERVTKRDGRVVAFRPEKIRDAVAAAHDAVGRSDPEFAAEVAALVELTLEDEGRRKPGFVPHIEAIQDLVERALMELGRPDVAKAYILYRDRRARIRQALRVHRSDALRAPLRVRESEGVSPWSKGRLVAALIEEAELPRASAEEVASAVERRVFASGLRRITTGLVRELVAGELLERGWTRAVASTGVVGLARHDLRKVLRAEPLQAWQGPAAREGGPRPVTARVAGEVLSRHALDEVVPGGIGELHRSGDLHVEDLGAPHLALSMAVDSALLASGGTSASSAFAALEGAAELARRVSRVLVLERPAAILAPLARAARPGSPLGLAGWLRALAAIARAAGVRIDLGSPGARAGALTARLVEALAELPGGASTGSNAAANGGSSAPGLTLDGHELEELLAEHPDLAGSVDRLLAQGRLASSWGDEDEAYAGPGLRRRRREPGILSCGGAIALNLPRLARRAGAWREDLVQSGLAELVQASIELAAALEAFQRAHDSAQSPGLHARRGFAIVPVGLREALLIQGEGEIDPDQGARLLGLLGEAARRFAHGGIQVAAPCASFGENAAARFAWLDDRSARAGGKQRWLFAEAEGSEPDAPRPYTAGLRLSPVAAAASGRHEAEALRTLGSGALSFAGIPGVRDAADPTPHLSAWRRFEVLRRARAGEVELELFPRSAPGAGTPRANRSAMTPATPTPTLRPLA